MRAVSAICARIGACSGTGRDPRPRRLARTLGMGGGDPAADGREHPHGCRRPPEQGGRDSPARRSPRRRRGGARHRRCGRRAGARRRPLLRRAARQRGPGRQRERGAPDLPRRVHARAAASRCSACAAGWSPSGGSPPRTAARSRRTTPSTSSTTTARPRSPSAAAAALVPQRKDSFTPGAARGRLAARPLHLCRLRARQRDPAGGAGAHVGARRHRQQDRLRPRAVPLAPARRDRDHPGDARGVVAQRPDA